MHALQSKLICIVGPTASGKTALAQFIAEEIHACVLSADSMQVYQGMDIGTGKIPVSDRTVDYYGLDLVTPHEPYSASLFQAYGRHVVDTVDASGGRVVVCGGTGFYVRALIDSFDFPAGEQVDNPVRNHYAGYLAAHGAQALWDELYRIDPASARAIYPNDSKRVIRAFELLSEGMHYATQKEHFASIEAYYPSCMIGLAVDPAVLNERINTRVENMIEQGLVDEVQGLLAGGYRDAITAQQAIGYKEIVDYLDGACSLDEAVERIQLATRRYAKRQRTWFRKDMRIHWLEATSLDEASLLDRALQIMKSSGAL